MLRYLEGMWPIISNNKTWPLVLRKALLWENDLLTRGFIIYSRGRKRWTRKPFEGINTLHLPAEMEEELFLRPFDNSTTFFPGPGVTVTLTIQRKEERRVHIARTQQDGGWIPIGYVSVRQQFKHDRPLTWGAWAAETWVER